jgi:hypothetical protein
VQWDLYRAAKSVGALATLLVLGWIFQNAEVVTDAYTADHQFDSLDLEPLTFSAATIPPSDGSMDLAEPPDTSEEVISRLAFTDEPTTDPSIDGGTSELSGSVSGLGPDDVAQVWLTRVTDGGEDKRVIPVSADGQWSANDIKGGRYRVRAFAPGLRATNELAVLFLMDGQSRRLELSVTTPPEGVVLEVVADELFIGERAVVAVTVGRKIADGEGRTVILPVSGVETRTSFSPVVSLLSSDVAVSDGGGAVRYLLSCDRPGQAAVAVSWVETPTVPELVDVVSADGSVDEPTEQPVSRSAVLTLPPCVERPPPDADVDGDVDG